jgi:hypothetical protein
MDDNIFYSTLFELSGSHIYIGTRFGPFSLSPLSQSLSGMSSSSSNSTVLVTATGVLVDPRLSCVLRVNENTPIESLLRELSQKLTIQYNDFIKPIPPIELGPFDILIGCTLLSNCTRSLINPTCIM